MSARETAERLTNEHCSCDKCARSIQGPIEHAFQEARREALEAAAKVAETFDPPNPRGAEIAAAIRNLKAKK